MNASQWILFSLQMFSAIFPQVMQLHTAHGIAPSVSAPVLNIQMAATPGLTADHTAVLNAVTESVVSLGTILAANASK